MSHYNGDTAGDGASTANREALANLNQNSPRLAGVGYSGMPTSSRGRNLVEGYDVKGCNSSKYAGGGCLGTPTSSESHYNPKSKYAGGGCLGTPTSSESLYDPNSKYAGGGCLGMPTSSESFCDPKSLSLPSDCNAGSNAVSSMRGSTGSEKSSMMSSLKSGKSFPDYRLKLLKKKGSKAGPVSRTDQNKNSHLDSDLPEEDESHAELFSELFQDESFSETKNYQNKITATTTFNFLPVDGEFECETQDGNLVPEMTVSAVSFQRDLLDKYQTGPTTFDLTKLDDMSYTSNSTSSSFEKDPTFDVDGDDFEEPEDDIVYLGTTKPPLLVGSKEFLQTITVIKAEPSEIEHVSTKPSDKINIIPTFDDDAVANVTESLMSKRKRRKKENTSKTTKATYSSPFLRMISFVFEIMNPGWEKVQYKQQQQLLEKGVFAPERAPFIKKVVVVQQPDDGMLITVAKQLLSVPHGQMFDASFDSNVQAINGIPIMRLNNGKLLNDRGQV